MAGSSWTGMFKTRPTRQEESTQTNQIHGADPSNPTRYHGGWLTPGTLPNMNLLSSPANKAPLDTPPLQESPIADPLSVERHIRDAMQELRAIEQEINIWTVQLAKGGQPEVVTRDIEAPLVERKDMFARVPQKLYLLEASSHTHCRDREPSPVPHSSTTGTSPNKAHT